MKAKKPPQPRRCNPFSASPSATDTSSLNSRHGWILAAWSFGRPEPRVRNDWRNFSKTQSGKTFALSRAKLYKNWPAKVPANKSTQIGASE